MLPDFISMEGGFVDRRIFTDEAIYFWQLRHHPGPSRLHVTVAHGTAYDIGGKGSPIRPESGASALHPCAEVMEGGVGAESRIAVYGLLAVPPLLFVSPSMATASRRRNLLTNCRFVV